MDGHIPHYVQHAKAGSNRSFGVVFSVLFLLIALQPLIYGLSVKLWAIAVSFIFVVLTLVFPAVLTPLNLVWTKIGILLHRLLSPVILGILFFCVFMPTGILMRLFNKDPLRLKLDKKATSYWIDRTSSSPTSESFINQF